MVCIDDGSNDGTQELLRCLALEANPKVFIAKHIANSGPSHARNIGIDLSNGRYVTFVDSDDFVSNDFVSKIVEALKTNKPDMLVFGYSCLSEENDCISDQFSNFNDSHDQLFLDGKGFVREYLYGLDPLGGCTWGKVVSLSLLKDKEIYFAEDIRYHEDALFWTQISQYVNKVVSIQDNLYCYKTFGLSRLSGSSCVDIDLEAVLGLKRIAEIIDRFYPEYSTMAWGRCRYSCAMALMHNVECRGSAGYIQLMQLSKSMHSKDISSLPMMARYKILFIDFAIKVDPAVLQMLLKLRKG